MPPSEPLRLRGIAERIIASRLRLWLAALGYVLLCSFLLWLDMAQNGRPGWSLWPLLGAAYALTHQAGEAWRQQETLRRQLRTPER